MLRFILCVVILFTSLACWAKTAPPTSQPTAPPSSQPTTAPTTAPAPADPFARLRVVTPRDKLPPVRSIRVRDKREQQDRSREGKVRISIGTRPKGARVYYGGKLLGKTPLTLTAHKGSTPFDVVIRAGGFMTLRTRIRRKENRGYFFKMHPAKIR
jgi:hypothetical protein